MIIWIGPFLFIQSQYLLSDILTFGRPYYTYSSIPMIVIIALAISCLLIKRYKIAAVSMIVGTLYGIYLRTTILQNELITGRRTMTSEVAFYQFVFIGAIAGIAIDALVRIIRKQLSR